jgi:hypothetical protein
MLLHKENLLLLSNPEVMTRFANISRFSTFTSTYFNMVETWMGWISHEMS